MSNFFKKRLGADSNPNTDGSFDVQPEPIPDKTECLAFIESAGWDDGNPEFDQEPYISLAWRVLKPGQHGGRVIFQKVRVEHADQGKADRAVKMLQAIDHNAGGVIAGHDGELDDTTLQKALVQKPMIIRVMKWEMNGGSGNWIAAVSPKPNGQAVPEIPTASPKAKRAPSAAPKTTSFVDDDLPF